MSQQEQRPGCLPLPSFLRRHQNDRQEMAIGPQSWESPESKRRRSAWSIISSEKRRLGLEPVDVPIGPHPFLIDYWEERLFKLRYTDTRRPLSIFRHEDEHGVSDDVQIAAALDGKIIYSSGEIFLADRVYELEELAPATNFFLEKGESLSTNLSFSEYTIQNIRPDQSNIEFRELFTQSRGNFCTPENFPNSSLWSLYSQERELEAAVFSWINPTNGACRVTPIVLKSEKEGYYSDEVAYLLAEVIQKLNKDERVSFFYAQGLDGSANSFFRKLGFEELGEPKMRRNRIVRRKRPS